MFENKVIKRIPGAPPPSPQEKQGYIEDLGKLSKVQLIELLERQNSLLINKAFIKRLPDKGEKITAFKCRLEAELHRRKEVDNTAALLEKLNINCPVEEIEWTGKYSEGDHEVDEDTTKGDDNATSVLKMLASHGRTSKIERLLKSPEELITQKDLEEVNVIKDPYAKALCSKVAERNSHPMKEVFKPFRTLKVKGDSSVRQRPSSRNSQTDGQKPEEGKVEVAKGEAEEIERVERDDGEAGSSSADAVKRVRHWEVTAATPPPPVHDQTVLLDLEESIALEKAAVEKTLEARTKQSMIRLAEQLQRGSFTQYRDEKEISSDEDEDEDDVKKKEEQEECGDEYEEPERDVAVVFSVVDCNDEAG